MHGLSYHLLFPVFTIILLRPPFALSASQAGVAMAMYGLADGGLSLLCAPLVVRFGVRPSLIAGYLVCGLSFVFLSFHPPFAGIVAILGLAGFALSVARLSLRTFMAGIAALDERLRTFSTTYIGVNAGAAIGLSFAFSIPFRTHPAVSLLAAAAGYLLAGAWIAASLHAPISPPEPITLPQLVRAFTGRATANLGVRAGWRYVAISFAGAYCMFLLFELTAPYFEVSIGAPPELGRFFAINALCIIVGQRYVTTLFRRCTSGMSDAWLATGFIWNALGIGLLAYWWRVDLVWVSVIFITLGEMFLLPHIDFLLSQRTHPSLHPYFFSLIQVSFAIGRAFVAGFGLRYLDLAQQHHWSLSTWWYANAIAIAVIAAWLLYRALRTKKISTETLAEINQ